MLPTVTISAGRDGMEFTVQKRITQETARNIMKSKGLDPVASNPVLDFFAGEDHTTWKSVYAE